MRTITLVLAFLAYTLHSRRVHTTGEGTEGRSWAKTRQASLSQSPDSVRRAGRRGLKTLAALCLTCSVCSPTAGFQRSGAASGLRWAMSNFDASIRQRKISMQSSSPRIKFYTHTACPFAQRVWIALEASGIPYEKVGVNLYGSGGFDKSELRKVEASGGLKPKGYIPVMSIDDEVIRESSVLVDRVAELSDEVSGAASLLPEKPDVARDLIRMCNSLPTSTSSFELTALLKKADQLLGESTFLAGDTFSIADACLLPFFQRVEDDFPGGVTKLKSYMDRMRQLPAFSKTVVSSWWYWW